MKNQRHLAAIKTLLRNFPKGDSKGEVYDYQSCWNAKKEYFISYMNLIMNAFGCSVDEAKDKTLERLFRLKENDIGKETFYNFTWLINCRRGRKHNRLGILKPLQ